MHENAVQLKLTGPVSALCFRQPWVQMMMMMMMMMMMKRRLVAASVTDQELSAAWVERHLMQ
jgi:hypothetical protein